MTSDVLTQGQIYDAADAVISQRLSQINGVGGVNINGSALPAVRVEINPLALAKVRHRPAGRARRDLQRQRQCAQGRDRSPMGCTTRSTPTTMPATRRPVPRPDHRQPQRRAVRLSDVATVLDMQDGATENHAHLRPVQRQGGGARCRCYQQPGANIVQVVDAVKAELPVLKSRIDPKIDLVVTFRPLGHDSRLAAPGRADPAARGADGDSGGLHVPEQLSGPR